MKIKPGEQVAGQVTAIKHGPDAKPGAFQKVLQRTMQSTGQTRQTTSVSPPPDIEELGARLQADESTPLIDRLERFLDVLDGYREKLGNPAITGDELQETITILEGETRVLEETMERLPESEALRDLLNRALVATTVEIAKFRRGDYT